MSRPRSSIAFRLQDHTLDLLDSLHVHVLPQRDGDEGQGQHAGTRNAHALLRHAIGLHNGISDGTANLVAQLDLQVAIDVHVEVLCLVWEQFEELRWQRVGPDGARHGASDAGADGGGQTEQSEESCDLSVLGDSHDGHLLANDEGSAGEGDEDLTHHNVSDVDVWLSEMNHQSTAEHLDWQGAPCKPLEAPRPADQDTDDDRPEARADIVDV